MCTSNSICTLTNELLGFGRKRLILIVHRSVLFQPYIMAHIGISFLMNLDGFHRIFYSAPQRFILFSRFPFPSFSLSRWALGRRADCNTSIVPVSLLSCNFDIIFQIIQPYPRILSRFTFSFSSICCGVGRIRFWSMFAPVRDNHEFVEITIVRLPPYAFLSSFHIRFEWKNRFFFLLLS